MSIYYIQTADGLAFHLDATMDISKTMSGKITDNPVEGGDVLSDHYVHSPDSFTLSGIVTDVQSFTGDGRTPKDYIDKLSEVKRSKQQFTFYFGDKIAPSLNCMFEMLKVSQDSNNGHNSAGTDSFKIQANIRQIDFAEQAVITVQRDFEFEDKFSEEAESAKTTEEVKEFSLVDEIITTSAQLRAQGKDILF